MRSLLSQPLSLWSIQLWSVTTLTAKASSYAVSLECDIFFASFYPGLVLSLIYLFPSHFSGLILHISADHLVLQCFDTVGLCSM